MIGSTDLDTAANDGADAGEPAINPSVPVRQLYLATQSRKVTQNLKSRRPYDHWRRPSTEPESYFAVLLLR